MSREATAGGWKRWRLLIIILTAVLVAAAGGFYVVTMVGGKQAEERFAELEQITAQAAKAVSGALSGAKSKANKAVDTGAVSEALAAADAARLAELAASIKSAHNAVMAVRIFPVGHDAFDYSSSPPLTFAALELMRRAEKSGKATGIEAHLMGQGDDAYLATVKPIKQGDTVVGTVLVAISPDLVKSAFRKANTKAGEKYLEIAQTGAGKPVILARSGPKAFRQGPAKSLASVKGTKWRISGWPRSAPPKPETSELPIVPIAAGAGVLLVAGIGWWAFRRRKSAGASGGKSKASPAAAQGAGSDPDAKDAALAAKLAALPEGGAAEGGGVAVPAGEGGEASAEPAPGGIPGGADEPGAEAPGEASDSSPDLPAEVIRPSELRGRVPEQLNRTNLFEYARAIGSEAGERGHQTLVVGGDGRNSTPDLLAAVTEGLLASGRDVVEIGQVPSPVMYFTTHYLNTECGVMVTGSNGPAGENGLVVVLGGETLDSEGLQALADRVAEGRLESGEGTRQSLEVVDEYVRRISEEIPVALGNSYKVVLDCANGAASLVAPKLIRALGHDIVELNCEVDGDFPNHPPDPSDPANLSDLIAAVQMSEADLGFAFDGDGSRLAVADGEGNILLGDRLMMLLAVDVLSRNAGAQIVFDAKCSGRLAQVIKAKGGKPVLARTGHAFMKRRLRENQIPLAGEKSGRIYVGERWYGFDDGMYAGARLLEILMGLKRKPAEVFARLPATNPQPDVILPMTDAEAAELVDELREHQALAEARVTTVDGVRVDTPKGFGLARPASSRPGLSLSFAANDEHALQEVRGLFKAALSELRPDVELPF